MIVDLSSPEGSSVNEGIDTELAILSYASIDHLAALVAMEGKGSLLVKAIIKEAYRMIPIHPEDQNLLGMEWEGTVLIDKTLPFGLRSASKIFLAVVDAVHWILQKERVTKGLHYLDNYIFVTDDINLARLGIPVEHSKLEGPSKCLTFLSIEVDTECQN